MNYNAILEKRIEHPEYGSIRVVYMNGQTWLYVCDLAPVLECGTNTKKVVSQLLDDEYAIYSTGRCASAYVINRCGLWHLVVLYPDCPREFATWVVQTAFSVDFWKQKNIEASSAISKMLYAHDTKDAAKAVEDIMRSVGVLNLYLEDIEPKLRMAEAISAYMAHQDERTEGGMY